jgi:serine/threonine protein kinase
MMANSEDMENIEVDRFNQKGLHLNAPDKARPTVSDVRGFTHISESFDLGDDNQLIFLDTSFIIIADDGTVYYGILPIPKKEVSLQQAKDYLKLVPMEDIYPLFPSDFTLAPSMSWNEYYIKRPKLLSYHKLAGSSVIAERFLDEAQTLELIRRNPHPNIAHFAGCVVGNNRIIGLALSRYSVELGDRIKNNNSRPLNRALCIHGIVAGLKHLHSLGLAHNDLNLSNIMLNEQDVPKIIDYGSCKPFGDPLYEGGTPGWNENFDSVSSLRNDETGLKKICEWLGAPKVYDRNVVQVVR